VPVDERRGLAGRAEECQSVETGCPGDREVGQRAAMRDLGGGHVVARGSVRDGLRNGPVASPGVMVNPLAEKVVEGQGTPAHPLSSTDIQAPP
jgi:hypothetical protein